MTDIKLCQFSKVVFDNGFKNKFDQYIKLTVANVLGVGGPPHDHPPPPHITINIIVKGWCWKSLLGGGALYGPADWNGSLSGQEVRLSQDYNFIFFIFSTIIFMATNILVIINHYGYIAMGFYLAKR